MLEDEAKQSIEKAFEFLVRQRGYVMTEWRETNFNWIIRYQGYDKIIEVQVDLRDPFVYVLLSDPKDISVAGEMKYLEGKKKYLQEVLHKHEPPLLTEDQELQQLGGKWDNVPEMALRLGTLLENNIDHVEKSNIS